VSSPQRNFRPDRPQLRVVPRAPEAVSYGWLQRRNGGWFWAMLLGVLFGGLILFSPTGCPDSKPLFRKAASNDRPYASRVRAFSSVELLGSLSEPS